MPLVIDNDGPEIVATNYWDSPIGQYYVSVNAGAFRVLLAPEAEAFLPDMKTATGAAVSRGPWPAAGKPDAFELLFDDGSDSPFALQTSLEAFDRVPSSDDDGKRRVLSVWVGRDGWPLKVVELPCTYRLAARLPDLRPWAEA